ncbi:MAG: Uma2 family endonuclease [Geitlerinemataceae cyanobacterium]
MLAANDAPHLPTAAAYFEWEAQQPEKYEYIDGRVYAMSGGSVNHGRLAIRLTSLFDTHLDGTNCIPGNSDIKIEIAGTQNYTYPDASVTCDDRDKANPNYFTYPCLIVEVLSKGTEAYDRGGKFRLYRRNPALRDYLLVSSTRVEMDLYSRADSGDWTIVNYQAGDTIELRSIGLSFAIEQIYRGLELTPER